MIERQGLRGTEQDGIFFTESPGPAGTRLLRQISVKKSRQNLSLPVIKSMMALQATHVGANAIVDLKYGQRSHRWWEQVFTFKWDTEEESSPLEWTAARAALWAERRRSEPTGSRCGFRLGSPPRLAGSRRGRAGVEPTQPGLRISARSVSAG